MKGHLLKYKGDKASLAPITEDCVPLWTKWLNDPEVSIPLGDEAFSAVSQQTQQDSYKSLCSNTHAFSILENNSLSIIGRCLVFGIDHVNGRCTIGIFIGDKSCWNKGLGTDALTLLLDHCFCILNMHNVMLGVFEFNKRAIACYKGLGFKEIGARREVRKINGRRYSALFMDLLSTEYRPVYLDKLINGITGAG